MANNESKVLKNNTLEEWRQKTNEISYELGDVDQLDSRLTDKVYTYSSTSESVFSVFDNDAASKNLRFELKPEQVIDAPATIIMTGAPTIPASFVADKVLFQGSAGSETFTGTINFINVNKISLKNTTGTFNASLPIKFSTDSIAANKLVRLVTESYKIGYVRASQDSIIAYQELRQDGFHIPNLSLRVVLTGSPSIPASFTEGAVVTQANGFSGVLYRATTSELLFKSHSGTFSTTAFAGIPHTDNSNRLAAANLSSQVSVDNTIGNIVEFHTLPTSDDIVITSTNAIDAIIEIQDDIGEITSLGTTNKSDVVSSINELETAVRGTTANYTLSTTSGDLVGAINEHETDIGNMTLTGLTATDISAALRELRVELGNHASLGTTYTTDAVGAINELETAVRGTTANYTIGTNANDLVGAINEIETVLRAGQTDYALTTSAQNVRDAIREHETDIGNMTFTGLAAADISAAIRELRTELGDHSTINDAAGYSATSASAGIVELQGDVGNVDSLTTSATKVVLAINELDLKQGSATLGTTATTLSGAVNEFETALRGTQTNYTLTTNASNFRDAVNELELGIRGTSNNLVATDLTTVSNDLVGAINEHETQINTLDTNHLNRNLAAGVNQDVNGSITFKGDSVDFSNTTALFSAAGGVANFGSAFVNLNATSASGSNVNIQGLQVDRTALSGSNPKHDVRLIWNETLVGSKPARAWQLRGMADDKSDNTADIVTFYNAEDLVANNTESGINATWDSTNQNFDFNVADPTLTFTSSTFRSSGNLGQATITDLGNTTFALTADKLDLADSQKILLGTDDDMEIYHDGANGYIKNGTGYTIVEADNFNFRRNSGASMITATAAQDVSLFYNGGSKLQTKADGVNVTGEIQASSLDINGSADISANASIGGTLSVAGNTTLGNASNDTVSIPGNLTITGDLTVNGTNTVLNTSTLEVEDILVLTGSGTSSLPTTSGFGLETKLFSGRANQTINSRTWSSTGKHPNAASNVTGSHSIVFNFGYDPGGGNPKGRWEMDGSPLLSSATLGTPSIEGASFEQGDNLNFVAGTGMTLTTGKSGTTHTVTYTHDRLAPNENIFKNIAADSGGTATANINNDTLTISGGTALESARSGDTITVNHSNVGAGASHYGPATEDGGYIRRINVNAQGHVTSVTTDNFNDIYVREDETSSANTANFVVRRDGNTIRATTFSGALSGNASTATKLATARSIGGTNFDGSANINIAEINVTEDNSDNTFRRLIFHKGDGTGTKELFHDDSLLYRASDNVLSAGTFSGSGASLTSLNASNISSGTISAARVPTLNQSTTGNAATASQIVIGGKNDNTTYRLLFGEANTGYNAGESLFKSINDNLKFNPSTGTLTATTFAGVATQANTVYVTNATASAAYRMVFGEVNDGVNGYESLHKANDADFHYNPGTNTLTVGNIVASNITGTSSAAGNADTVDSLHASSFIRSDASDSFSGTLTGSNQVAYVPNDYGKGVFGLYSSTKYQHVWGMGSSYKMHASGNNLGNLYGLAWTHSNVGADYAGSHQLLHVINGTVTCAMGTNLWTSGTVTASGGNSTEWNTAYDLASAATSGNTGNTIVYRNSSGNFSAGTITASLSGNASTASYASGSGTVYVNEYNSTTTMRLLGSHNGINTQGNVYSNAGIYMNMYTDTIYATTFNGVATGCSGNSATSTKVYVNNYTGTTDMRVLGSHDGIASYGNVYSNAGIYFDSATSTMYATGDVIAAASDDRLKDKKGNIENALEKVNALNGFYYNWNDKAVEIGLKTEEEKEEDLIGLSAQDVQKVVPELVTRSSVKGYDTVRYDKVTALLVEAVKELTEQNKELKAEIESLKSINS